MVRTVLLGCLLSLTALASFAQRSQTDSLRAAINPNIAEPQTIEDILSLSEILVDRGDMNEAREWLLMGYKISEEIGDSNLIFDILTQFSELYLSREMPDSSLIMLTLAEPHAVTTEQRADYHNLSGISRKMNEQFILAVEEYELAYAYSDSLGDANIAGRIQMNLGDVYSSLGDYTQALEAYYHGLENAEQIPDSSFMAVGYNNVGLKFYELEDYEQAEYYLNRAEQISLDLNFRVNLRRVTVNLGNLYSKLENFEEAERYFEQAQQLSEETGNPVSEIRVLYNIGNMEGSRGNFNRARELLNKTFSQSGDLGIIEGQFLSATSLGNLERDRGNLSSAMVWFERANEILDSGNFNSHRITAYENLYTIYKEAGQHSQSLEWLEKFNQLNSTLQSTEKNRLMAEYEIRFNMKRTEQEAEVLQARQERNQSRIQLQQYLIIFTLGGTLLMIFTAVLLIRSNSRRERTNNELQESNQTLSSLNETIQEQNEELQQVNQIKNKLFAIIAHDLRGPLSSLQSLLYLIREHDLSKAEIDELSSSLERNLQENSSMMDNLLAWAKSQMTGIHINSRKFPLRDCVKVVTDQIKFQTTEKKLTIITEIPESLKIIGDYDMIKLVIRNLVNNAVKFSTPGSKIYIKANTTDDEVIKVEVKDEGIGIKPGDRDKVFGRENFTQRGTNNEKGSGLGLTLCKEFVEKHGGSIWFETEEGKGTTFIFTLPVPQNVEDFEEEPAFLD